jgi:hypothetical protein
MTNSRQSTNEQVPRDRTGSKRADRATGPATRTGDTNTMRHQRPGARAWHYKRHKAREPVRPILRSPRWAAPRYYLAGQPTVCPLSGTGHLLIIDPRVRLSRR